MSESSKRILLAGAGHAHLEVIAGLTQEETRKHIFTLISPSALSTYSGALPRYLAGFSSRQSVEIPSQEFARSKGVHFVQGTVLNFSTRPQLLQLSDHRSLDFDLLSLNLGGVSAAGQSLSQVATLSVRPLHDFLPRWEVALTRLLKVVKPRVLVIGGGAAGVEIAAAVAVRLQKEKRQSAVSILTAGSRLCENYPPRISTKIFTTLTALGVQVEFNKQVRTIGETDVLLESGERSDFDLLLDVRPSVPSTLVSKPIDASLRVHPNIFAVGDGAPQVSPPSFSRSGVTAVRQGQHLLQSIRRVLAEQEPEHFTLRKHQLNILVTGANQARAVFGGFTWEGASALWLKNWIDRKYIARFYHR